MRHKFLFSAMISAAVMFWASGLVWAASANPPCPQIGFADGCDVQITLNMNGTANVTTTGQAAYDGSEDQLVGVTNNSGNTIASITLSGSDIFGFDGDGAGEPGNACLVTTPSTFGCLTGGPFGSTGYEGPNTSFSITDVNDGSVNFTGGLANGATAWFSLEEAPSTSGFTVTGTTTGTGTPEPASIVLFGTGLLGFAELVRRRNARRAA